MNKPKIIVILGPTASGKSDLAVQLAKKFGGEVISADSRQVYKGLDIGTGKITKKEMKGVTHHLLDVANPRKQFTVSDYTNLTNRLIRQIVKSGKVPIVCGGTGFYIDALLGKKNFPEVPPNLELRKELGEKTTEELFDILKRLDPVRATNIDSKNPRRLVRAIEICNTLGKVPSVQNLNYKSEIRNKYEVLKIGVAPITPSPTPSSYNKRKGLPEPSLVVREGRVSYFLDEQELKTRINKRLEKRIKTGMISEAKKLHKKGLSYRRMRELGLEYGRLADFLEKKITKKEMIEKLQTEIWHYAKRQMTYFKPDKSIVWLTPQISKIEMEVRKFLKNYCPTPLIQSYQQVI